MIGEIFNRVEATIREAKSQGLDDAEQIIGRVRRLQRELVAELEAHPQAVEQVVEEGAQLEPTIFEQIDKAASNAELAVIAKDLGIEVPADVKAAWKIGEVEVAGFAAKKDALHPIAQAKVESDGGGTTEPTAE